MVPVLGTMQTEGDLTITIGSGQEIEDEVLEDL